MTRGRSELIATALAVVAASVVALPAEAQGHQHQAHEHGVHSHRGPGPHFIDAFFVENAYLERKLRPDLFIARSDEATIYTARLEAEWAVHRRVALIAHVPAHRVSPKAGSSETGLGDISLGAKFAAVNDRQRFILGLGADVLFPTGDEERGLGEHHGAVSPFALAWLPFGAEKRWLIQGAAHVDIPTEGDEPEHAEVGTAVSWTSPLGLTPMLEWLVEFPLRDGDASWTVAPGFRWEFAEAWELGASVRLPLGGPKEEDSRFAFGLIRHFPLPH